MSSPTVLHFVNVTSGSSHLNTILLVNPFDLIYRCPAVVLSIAIFLSSLTPSHNARLDPDETWWLNPCSKQTQYRYGRSAAENQLRTFIDRIDTRFFKELRELYEQPAHHKQMRGSCIRVNNMLQSIRKTKNETEAKELFYDAMVQFAVFIDRLKKVPLQTDATFQIGRRRRLYEETKSNLKLLLCEYNDTLAKGDAVYLPPRTPRVPRINLRCLPKVMNHTEALNVDVSFFRKLKKFFRQSRAILKRKKQNKARRRSLKHRRMKLVQ